MKSVVLSASLFFVFSLFSGCERKEVTLSLMDTFTGGKQKEWLIAENYFIGTNVTEMEECYRDDTAIFSKGNSSSEKMIPEYTWKKNENQCSTLDDDLSLYFTLSGNTIMFGDQDILNGAAGDVWNIEKAENAEIIISQNKGTDNERRLRFVPLSNSSPDLAE